MTSAAGEKHISKELEDKLYEQKLLEKLNCIEKMTVGRHDRNIFIIHPNHGMLYQYKELARLLGKKYNVYGVKARGLAPGATMPETHLQMVDEYVEEILKVQDRGPFILSGFCVGNLIAYIIAQKLEKRKHKIEYMLCLDAMHFIVDYTYRLMRMMKYLPRFIEKKFMKITVENFERALRTSKFTLKESDEAGFRRVKVEKYMDIAGQHAFSFRAGLDAPMLIPHGLESDRPGATLEKFSRLTKGKATICKVPGTHTGMLEPPNVEHLAQLLLDTLAGEKPGN
ncbi:MAG: alpha/beta hydrolase [Candidatus Aminicenantes bacterium]|nr:alpha/beta hydrolase [Candidatus Aminicenantes bacterium]